MKISSLLLLTTLATLKWNKNGSARGIASRLGSILVLTSMTLANGVHKYKRNIFR